MTLSSFKQQYPFWLLLGVIVVSALFIFNESIVEQFSTKPAKDLSIYKEGSNGPMKTSRRLAEEESKGPTFLFIMGIEGTGHHLFLTLFQTYLKSGNGLSDEFFDENAIHKKLYLHPKWKPSLWSAPCAENPSNGTALFQEVVDTMKTIDFEIRSQSLEQTAAIVPLNAGFENFMNSYPSKHRDCRPLQYPDLDLTYAACEEAGVKCKHIVLSRDPYEIIRSTTMNREFDPKHRQIKLLGTMLDVINTQIVSYPDQLHACWSYNKGVESILNIGELLGWEATAFKNIYSDLFHAHTPLTDEDRRDIVPPQLQPFMDTMIASMERVEATCESVLNSQR